MKLFTLCQRDTKRTDEGKLGNAKKIKEGSPKGITLLLPTYQSLYPKTFKRAKEK